MALGVAAALPAGCISLGFTGGPLVASSADGSTRLETDLPTGVYGFVDENTANFYLTDLPLARLADPADRLADASGVLVHVHLFLVPKAGRTPVDATASNAAVRVFVLSGGAIGMYGGGGFLLPTGDPGDETLSGKLAEASLRLLRRTSDFADRLGPSILAGSVTGRRDDAAAQACAGRVAQWMAATSPAPGQTPASTPTP